MSTLQSKKSAKWRDCGAIYYGFVDNPTDSAQTQKKTTLQTQHSWILYQMTIRECGILSSLWMATFKMDTGAEVIAISKTTWQSLDDPDLQSPSKLLYGPAKKPLKTTGHFTCNLSHSHNKGNGDRFMKMLFQRLHHGDSFYTSFPSLFFYIPLARSKDDNSLSWSHTHKNLACT